MLRILANPKRGCDGVTRRDLVAAGGLGGMGLSLAALLRAEAAPRRPGGLAARSFGRAKSCIILYLYGAPSQLDTFDLKPNAPSDIRGEFNPIPSSLTGLQVCEHLPRMAKLMHRVSLVRSMTHPYNNHAVAYALSGIPFSEPAIEANEKEPRHWPYLGSVLDRVWSETQGSEAAEVPSNLILPWKLNSKTNNRMHGGLHAAWLGARHDPLVADFVGAASRAEGAPTADGSTPIRSRFDPFDGITPESAFQLTGGAPMSQIPLDRLDRRRTLLQQFDSARDRFEQTAVASHDHYQRLALSALTSSRLSDALNVRREPTRVRERYGMTLFGQGALAARRLVEAGVRLTTVFWDEHGPVNTAWDTHANHHPRLREGLLPGLDQVFPALLNDLEDRGMLDETLVLCMSEHGRTPKISGVSGGGREHWSGAYCGLFAGAGIARGNVVGSTDAEAGYPVDRPVSPKDILCTVYHLLGIDPHRMIQDVQDRLQPLVPEGEVVSELFA